MSSASHDFGAEDGAAPDLLSSMSSATHVFGAEDGARRRERRTMR
jgi:hypothetical protein